MRVLSRPGPGRWFGAGEREVLHGVGVGGVVRNPLFGDLGPWMLEGRPVGWPLMMLALHGLVCFDMLGVEAPRLTARGLEVLVDWG